MARKKVRRKSSVNDQARVINQQKRRRRRKKNYILYYILVLFLIAVTGVTLSITVFFNTKKIEVSPVEGHTQDEIIAYSGVEIGDNLLRMNLSRIEEAIMSHTTDLDRVLVERKFPDALSIKLTAAKPAAAVVYENSYYILSSGGRVMSMETSLEGYEGLFLFSDVDLSGIKVGDFVTGNESYRTTQQVLEAVTQSGISSILSLQLGDGADIRLNCNDKVTIVLGNVLEIDYKLKIAKQILEQEIAPEQEGLLDVSHASDAYFREMSMSEQKEKGYAVKEAAVQPGEEESSPEQAESQDEGSSQPEEISGQE